MKTRDHIRSSSQRRGKPEFPVMELIEGMPVYYRGYRQYLQGVSPKENVMGSGMLQSLITSAILVYLARQLEENEYLLSTNQSGLRISEKTMLANDIAVFKRNDIPVKAIGKGYFTVPPIAVIEIDTKADPEIEQSMNYPSKKTQLLLDFGVQEVIWIFTDPRKIWLATPNKPWAVVEWDQEISIMGHSIQLDLFLREKGIIL
ncbi:MAG: Uma2 family endonuclease [Saprospiraceae bacterium]|nr:Uma2 family endonuclease [Saprospiraceae bacterium]